MKKKNKSSEVYIFIKHCSKQFTNKATHKDKEEQKTILLQYFYLKTGLFCKYEINNYVTNKTDCHHLCYYGVKDKKHISQCHKCKTVLQQSHHNG